MYWYSEIWKKLKLVTSYSILEQNNNHLRSTHLDLLQIELVETEQSGHLEGRSKGLLRPQAIKDCNLRPPPLL